MFRLHIQSILIGLAAVFSASPALGFDLSRWFLPPVAPAEFKAGDPTSAGGIARSGSPAGAEGSIKRSDQTDLAAAAKPQLIGGVARGGSPEEAGGEYRGDMRGKIKIGDAVAAGGLTKRITRNGAEGSAKAGDPYAAGTMNKP